MVSVHALAHVLDVPDMLLVIWFRSFFLLLVVSEDHHLDQIPIRFLVVTICNLLWLLFGHLILSLLLFLLRDDLLHHAIQLLYRSGGVLNQSPDRLLVLSAPLRIIHLGPFMTLGIQQLKCISFTLIILVRRLIIAAIRIIHTLLVYLIVESLLCWIFPLLILLTWASGHESLMIALQVLLPRDFRLQLIIIAINYNILWKFGVQD